MNDLTVLLIGASVAVVVSLASLTKGRGLEARITALVGGVVTVIAVGLGFAFLQEKDAPSPLPGAVGLLPPRSFLPKPDRGFVASLATNVDSCANPVSVKLVLSGTSEYWTDFRIHTNRWGRRFPIVLVLPTGIVGTPRVRLASTGTAFQDPVDAEAAGGNAVRVLTSKRLSFGYVITGQVDAWPESSNLLPLLVTFDADWLTSRGLSTCYLSLPALWGTRTATVLTEAAGCSEINRADDPRKNICKVIAGGWRLIPGLELNYGLSVVTVRDGTVAPDLSTPTPSAVVNGNEAWTCPQAARQGAAPQTAVAHQEIGSGNNVAFGLDNIEETVGGNCRAVAAISENSVAYSRDLLLLLIGALAGLGVTLVVQTAIAAVSRRLTSEHEPEEEEKEDEEEAPQLLATTRAESGTPAPDH